MADSLTTLITKVQNILGDANGTYFTSAIVTAGVRQALNEFNLAVPVYAAVTITGVNDQYEYELSDEDSLATDILDVLEQGDNQNELDISLNYDKYWEDERLFFRLRQPETTSNTIIVRYTKDHTINGLDSAVESTIQAQHDQVIVDGAAFYAITIRATARVETINLSQDQSDNYREIAGQYQTAFKAGIAQAQRRSTPVSEPDTRAWNDQYHTWGQWDMPRTLPAALTTVMDAGIFEPYIRVKYNADPNDTLATTVQPLGFKLSALNAEVKIPSTSDDTAYFCIVRGALISGTPSTISSIWFKTVATQEDGRFTTLIGEPLHRSYLVITANSDYETVIETALADTPIVPSYEGTAGWKAYQFYPTGKNIILSPRKKIFTILQQKYLIFPTEDGWDGVNNNMFFFVATETRATDYSITDPLFTTTDHEETRRLITRDEASVVR